ncbi:MAG: glycosyltransferase [Bacteroidales bacterium]|nr:glycosyltransferase [Bacteroidales bacterium]
MDFTHLLTDTYNVVFLCVGIATLVYLSIGYGLVFMRVGRMKLRQAPPSGILPPVSVVIVAQNDADNLRRHIANILEQDYPDFEIIIVDYLSRDDTDYVMQICAAQYPNLKIVRIRDDVNFFHGKKYPLSLGIKSAQNDIIVLTDVNCEPPSVYWLRSVVSAYWNADIQIVLGFTHIAAKKTLLGHLQQYDNLVYNCQYLSAASLGFPYAASGSNLSYRRGFFFEKDGFIRHYVEPEGADDLFVNRNGNRINTGIALDENSMVEVDAAESYSIWYYRRRRRFSTRCYYSVWQRLRIVMRPLILLTFYASCIVLLARPLMPWLIPVLLLLLKLVWQIICVAQPQKRFKLKGYHWFSPLLELYFVGADALSALFSFHPKRCNP